VSAASWHADEDGKVVLLRDSIYQAIRHSILAGELQPGQELREQVSLNGTVSADRPLGIPCSVWNRKTW
jgi:Bacterial regulatory proteins, gntR family